MFKVRSNTDKRIKKFIERKEIIRYVQKEVVYIFEIINQMLFGELEKRNIKYVFKIIVLRREVNSLKLMFTVDISRR